MKTWIIIVVLAVVIAFPCFADDTLSITKENYDKAKEEALIKGEFILDSIGLEIEAYLFEITEDYFVGPEEIDSLINSISYFYLAKKQINKYLKRYKTKSTTDINDLFSKMKESYDFSRGIFLRKITASSISVYLAKLTGRDIQVEVAFNFFSRLMIASYVILLLLVIAVMKYSLAKK